MNIAKIGVVAAAVALAGMLWTLQDAAPATPPAKPAPGEFAIRDVRVFDGTAFVPRTTVLVRDGLIAAVAPDLDVPAGIEVIDGRGRTLLPGLIDAHVHTWGDARHEALRFGVTTVLDMFSDHRQLAAARSQRDDLTQAATADMWSAGTLATVDGGHGTQFGLAVPTVAAATDAPAWVAARLAEGSDFIKIVREDLHVYSDEQTLPTLDAATAAALIDAAHAQGLRAVVHASAQESARESLRDGADGLVHVFQDVPADPEIVALFADGDRFVVPTLSVVAAFSGRPPTLADDPRLRAWLSPEQLQSLGEGMRFAQPTPALLDNALESVRRLHAAGVVLLAGTDAPNPGTAQGVSMHGEIQLLAEAGLTPAQALAAATSAPARAFALADRGGIRPGLRADLLLVEGNPEQDLGATRAIVTVWKNGRPVDRRVAAAADTPVLMAGAISHFDGERIDSRLGSGWVATSDRMAGGNSDATIARFAGGAGGSAGALQVRGSVRAGSERRWAGAFLNPGDQMMQALDGSGLRELSFHVRGDGRELAVLLFTGMQGSPPQVRTIPTSAEWTEVKLPLAEFAGADLAHLRAIAITTSTEGEFTFELDQVEIR